MEPENHQCVAPTVRAATQQDVTNIAALMIQVWLHTYATQGVRGALSRYVLNEYSPVKIAADIASPEQLFQVACCRQIPGR